MKKIVIFMTLMFLVRILTAIPVSESKVVQVAGNWFSMHSSERIDTPVPNSVYKVYKNDAITLYLINYNNDGFVISSADDRCNPILAWSEEGSITPDSDNPGIQYWLKSYSDEVAYVVSNDFPSTETLSEWQSIADNQYSRIERNVEPLLPSRWNQDWPYNALCPEDSAGPGGRVYAGCVATAMAQCMRYWNYPEIGEGSHGYYAYGYGYQSVNFNQSDYDWWQMPMTAGSNYEMIAKLIYDCAVSVDMMFAPDGSGAMSYDVEPALKNYFGYANSVNYVERNSYSNTNWKNMLRAELDAQRVIYYSGHGDDGGGGHAFVIDGYREDDFFHFDFGWSGSGNGYYTINNLNPQGNFNAGQAAVVGIIPENYQPNNGVLIWDGMDSAECSGSEFYITMNELGISANQRDTLPYDLSGYDSVFLSFGNTQTGYSELTTPMADAIRRYLENGGSLYLEGADVLGVDQSNNSALMDLLGIDSVIDGSYNEINNLQGHPFSVGMNLDFLDSYQTNLETIDRYIPGDGQIVFTEEGYGVVAVQNVGIHGQKTVTMSYSLARLADNVDKAQFIQNIVSFFSSTATIHPAMNLNTLVENDQNITLTWTHPGMASSALLGYNIFDKGNLIHTIYNRQMITYTIENPDPGLHMYTVTAGYLDGESEPCNEAEAFRFGSIYADLGPTDETAETGLLLNPGGSIAIKYVNNETANLDFIRFYIQEADTNPIIIRVWDEVDGAPGTMLAQNVYRNNITNGWHTADIQDENLELTGNYYLGVTFAVNSSAIGVDNSTTGSSYSKNSSSTPWLPLNEGNLMIDAVLNTSTGIEDITLPIDSALSLANYPNPFNPTTTISFNLTESDLIEVSVYDIRGRKIDTLVKEKLSSGNHTLLWNGTDSYGKSVSSGVYFIRLSSSRQTITHKALLLK